jgi:hypothetical protein
MKALHFCGTCGAPESDVKASGRPAWLCIPCGKVTPKEEAVAITIHVGESTDPSDIGSRVAAALRGATVPSPCKPGEECKHITREMRTALEQKDLELAKLRQIIASYEGDGKGTGDTAPTLKGILLDDFRRVVADVTALDEHIASVLGRARK